MMQTQRRRGSEFRPKPQRKGKNENLSVIMELTEEQCDTKKKLDVVEVPPEAGAETH